MIILLQGVTIQLRSLFDIFHITKCGRLLFQSASGITKCDTYYKARRNRE